MVILGLWLELNYQRSILVLTYKRETGLKEVFTISHAKVAMTKKNRRIYAPVWTLSHVRAAQLINML